MHLFEVDRPIPALGVEPVFLCQKGVALMNFSASDHMICLTFAAKDGKVAYIKAGAVAR